jgi:hypothetical protein
VRETKAALGTKKVPLLELMNESTGGEHNVLMPSACLTETPHRAFPSLALSLARPLVVAVSENNLLYAKHK